MSVLQIHLILIHRNLTYGMQCSTCTNVTHQSRPTLTEVKNVVQATWAGLPQGPNSCSNTVVLQKAPGMKKAAIGHFEHAV